MTDQKIDPRAQALVDAVGDALGVDTGTIHEKAFGEACKTVAPTVTALAQAREALADVSINDCGVCEGSGMFSDEPCESCLGEGEFGRHWKPSDVREALAAIDALEQS